MKKIFLIPVIALLVVSCNKNQDASIAVKDASALKIEALESALQQQQLQLAKQSVIDSMQMMAELKAPMFIPAAAAPIVERKVIYVKEPKRKMAQVTPVTIQQAPEVAQAPVDATPSISQPTEPVATVPAETAKKGWSNTAKGAVIGAGVGAIGGAVISKKHRVKGAVVGGLIGAVAGAGTGVILDKRNKYNEFQ